MPLRGVPAFLCAAQPEAQPRLLSSMVCFCMQMLCMQTERRTLLSHNFARNGCANAWLHRILRMS